MFRKLDCIIKLTDMKFPVKETIFVGESAAEDVELLDKFNLKYIVLYSHC